MVKYMLINLSIVCCILYHTLSPIVESQIDYSTDENLSIALDEISTTGIDLQPTETCELVEFYYPTDSQDSHFLLRVQLSKNEYSSIVLQLQSSDRYQLIEATEDGLRGITGNTKYFEYRYGIKFNEVTDIYRAWTAGKTRFTMVTLFIFTCANNECILTILRY